MSSLASTVEDRTIYPEEERVGEDIVQRWIVEVLRPLIQRWFSLQNEEVFVGADQFIYYEQYNPHRRVAPDVYVLPGVSPDTPVRSWKCWQTGIVPSFAFEVVSTNWEKDYCTAPVEYERLGVQELVIFDPYFEERRDGMRWQRFARSADGQLVMTEHSDGLVLFSQVLGCYLRAVGLGSQLRIRLSEHRDSTLLFPTAEEAERQAKEAERQAKEAERQAKEAERQAKEAALARVAELEALLKARP